MSRFNFANMRYTAPFPSASQTVNGDANVDKIVGQVPSSLYHHPSGHVTSAFLQQQHHTSWPSSGFDTTNSHYQNERGGAFGQRPRQGHREAFNFEGRQSHRYGAQKAWHEEEYQRGWYGQGRGWHNPEAHAQAAEWQEERPREEFGGRWSGQQYSQYQRPTCDSGSSFYWQDVLRPAAPPRPTVQRARRNYGQERYAPYPTPPAEAGAMYGSDWHYQARPQLITDYFPADGLDQGNIIQSAGDGVRGTRRSKRLQEKSAEPRSSLPPSSLPPAESRQQRRTQTPIQFLLQRPLPAPFYLRNANHEPKRMDSPRPLLVVLDLNGTLLCRKGRGSNFAARPRVNEFLEYLLSRHIVMVWSSARPVNVDNMCKKLFSREQMDQLVGVWARDKLNLTPEQYNERVQVYKQLSWIWSDPTINGKRPWSQADTVLIDDSAEKAASEPHNVIEIEEFENRKDQLETDVLGQVVQYLDELSHQQDVSAYMRAHPFKWVPETKDGVDGKADTPMQ